MPIPNQKTTHIRMTAKERIYTTLQEWIVEGTLLPGERLNDTELAEYFSVSRTPVREALQLLTEQKLVQVVPSSGTYVAPIDKEELHHVYALLIDLQMFAVRLSIERITDADLAQLEKLNEAFHHCEQAGNISDTINADSAFHLYFCKIAGNSYLTQFSEALFIHTRRNENLYFREASKLETSYQSHKQLLEALKEKNLERALQEVQRNWAFSIQTSGDE